MTKNAVISKADTVHCIFILCANTENLTG